jgi:hypothetical protein
MAMIDAVSETTRLPWDEVYRMGIFEFFNIYSYTLRKWKQQQDRMIDVANKYK